jgi:uncharacterized protein YjbI with pentapeptide repeats
MSPSSVDGHGVIGRSWRWSSPTPWPLSKATILVAVVVLLGVAGVVFFGLFLVYAGADPTVEVDVRTIGTIVFVGVGALALWLATRQRRFTELRLEHAEKDATERRVTELYSKAADQLGSGKAPVRLAGLYALERLANASREQRQTIVDVICAYLRMPYDGPGEMLPAKGNDPGSSWHSQGTARQVSGSNGGAVVSEEGERAREEREVRLAAQEILTRNLRYSADIARSWRRRRHDLPGNIGWPKTRLNLRGATLMNADFSNCHIENADFSGVRFIGAASFEGATFTGTGVNFRGAEFEKDAMFSDARFNCDAVFDVARFGQAFFYGAQFERDAAFIGTTFWDHGTFVLVRFAGRTVFLGARFGGKADFSSSRFSSSTWFNEAKFDGKVDVTGATVPDYDSSQAPSWPEGWTVRNAGQDIGNKDGAMYLVPMDGSA